MEYFKSFLCNVEVFQVSVAMGPAEGKNVACWELSMPNVSSHRKSIYPPIIYLATDLFFRLYTYYQLPSHTCQVGLSPVLQVKIQQRKSEIALPRSITADRELESTSAASQAASQEGGFFCDDSFICSDAHHVSQWLPGSQHLLKAGIITELLFYVHAL